MDSLRVRQSIANQLALTLLKKDMIGHADLMIELNVVSRSQRPNLLPRVTGITSQEGFCVSAAAGRPH